MTVQLETRNAGLNELRALLVDQHARKIDVVTPASRIKAKDGNIVLSGNEMQLTEDGFTDVNGVYRPTSIFDEGIAEKLSIPLAYVRRLRNERPDLYDANVNGLLRGKFRTTAGQQEMLFAPDERSFLFRAFRDDDGGEGVARAFLSDRFAIMDNLDVLVAAIEGVRRAGVEVEIDGCDLSDRRMYVRIKAPEVTALAPSLLKGYRSPFSGNVGTDNPTVFAGLVISNSEVGSGAFSIVPRMIFEVCNNGATITKDAVRNVHLGGKLDHGIIRWSEETESTNLKLITQKARDSVATFLDVDYMTKVLRDMEELSDKEIKVVDDVKLVTKKLAFDQEQSDLVFAMFVKGGQMTAGGVLNAVTAAAQQTKDADKAHDMESSAFKALELAAGL
jgi:hypothetical protein